MMPDDQAKDLPLSRDSLPGAGNPYPAWIRGLLMAWVAVVTACYCYFVVVSRWLTM